jgi:hypothetical protein
VRQAVGEHDHHQGVFTREGEQTHGFTTERQGQRHTGQDRHVGIGFAIRTEHLLQGDAGPIGELAFCAS